MTDRDLVAQAVRAHQLVRGIRDGKLHCKCGWSISPREGTFIDHFINEVYEAIVATENAE